MTIINTRLTINENSKKLGDIFIFIVIIIRQNIGQNLSFLLMTWDNLFI